MASKNKDISFYFDYKDVRPNSLVQDNVITFNYKSPEGVHDKAPLVYVLEKQLDRIFGLNLHYDSKQFFDIITTVQLKVNKILEQEYYKKYPEKRKELREQRVKFDKALLTEEDKKQFGRRVNKKDLDQFLLKRTNKDTMRSYLYKRMNNVNKLVWKL